MLELSAFFSWTEHDGDGALCHNCSEPIYGRRYNYTSELFGTKIESALNLCQPCMTLKLDQENQMEG